MGTLDFVERELAELEQATLRRSLFCVDGPQGRTVHVDGRELVCFCSNNYLDLAADPRVRRAAAEAAEESGAGSAASRLLNGNMALHETLEHRLATFERVEACLLFPTGYMANVGTICSLVGRGDAVVADRLSHASLMDGCRLSGARFRVYPHCDMSALDNVLRRQRQARRRLIVTDTVFSMDGDLAPLREIVSLAQRHKAIVLADEAHATGVLGEHGRGAAELLGVESEIDVRIGTLSKALGSLGGFVAASGSVIDYLRNRARTFIYTTAPPPSVVSAALAALEIVQSEPRRRQRLSELAALARAQLVAAGMKALPGMTPIVPVMIGDPAEAMQLSDHLRSKGFLLPAIRPPTVPAGTARLRVSLQCSHTARDIGGLAEACAQWVRARRP